MLIEAEDSIKLTFNVMYAILITLTDQEVNFSTDPVEQLF